MLSFPRSLFRRLIIGVLVLLLAGCSSLRLGYANGPQLAWWWLDGYLDFSRAQAPAVREGIERWFDWHRATQLPEYAALLAAAAAEVVEPTTPARACRWQARLRDALEPALQRAIDLGADQLPGLGESQIVHLEQRYAKGIDEMREDFLQPDDAERRRESVRRTLERAERLYGRLGDAQRRVIADGVAASPFDPEAWLVDRQRRQRDTVQVLRRLLTERADRDARLAALRTLVVRTERSPDADYRAYQERLAAYNCDFAARIHNATTPAQRQRARETLEGWAADLRSLAPPG